MNRLAALALVVLATSSLADVNLKMAGADAGVVRDLNCGADGGLSCVKVAGSRGDLRCLGATATEPGCLLPNVAQTTSGQKTFANGAQDTCVAHGSLTACNAGNAGLHQCCSTHGGAQVWCNGTVNIELSGTTSYSILPGLYINGILHGGLLVIASETLPYAYTLTNISGFIAAGSGAGTLTLRRSDGVNLCECSVDCDSDLLNLTCSGNCTYAANTQTITAVTNDTCTSPPTVKGILFPAGYRL